MPPQTKISSFRTSPSAGTRTYPSWVRLPIQRSTWSRIRTSFGRDVTKVFSKHTVKFGGEFRKMFMNFRQHGQPSGSFSFSSAVTQRVIGAATSQTQGNGFASFLLG